MHLPRWFRWLLAADAVLVVLAVVLGARMLLDAAPQAGRVVDWGRRGVTAPGSVLPESVLAPPAVAPRSGAAAQPRLGPGLLRRLDSDAASSANAQRGLLGLLEEAIRVRIVDILDGVAAHGRGG
jgi:hypothetical protein